jgi:hypothetical protein
MATTATPVVDGPLALDVLAIILVENEQPTGYDRSLFPHWLDLDGDGCSTRAEVLIRDSVTPAQVDPFGCGVVAGDWVSPYDGAVWSDPGDVDIDHVVALKEAWDSGAWRWDANRRMLFANDLDDPRTLRAVTDDVNQAKSDKDPSNWLPPRSEYVCTYLADWVAIKARWGLSMDQSERGRIRNVLADRCPDQRIRPWPAPPTLAPIAPPPTDPPPVAPPVAPPASGACDPSYPGVCIPPPPPDLDCGDIPYRRFPVVGPDPHRFDGNDDGVGCEG